MGRRNGRTRGGNKRQPAALGMGNWRTPRVLPPRLQPVGTGPRVALPKASGRSGSVQVLHWETAGFGTGRGHAARACTSDARSSPVLPAKIWIRPSGTASGVNEVGPRPESGGPAKAVGLVFPAQGGVFRLTPSEMSMPPQRPTGARGCAGNFLHASSTAVDCRSLRVAATCRCCVYFTAGTCGYRPAATSWHRCNLSSPSLAGAFRNDGFGSAIDRVSGTGLHCGP
jgi:hypothetical protein